MAESIKECPECAEDVKRGRRSVATAAIVLAQNPNTRKPPSDRYSGETSSDRAARLIERLQVSAQEPIVSCLFIVGVERPGDWRQSRSLGPLLAGDKQAGHCSNRLLDRAPIRHRVNLTAPASASCSSARRHHDACRDSRHRSAHLPHHRHGLAVDEMNRLRLRLRIDHRHATGPFL
jgi:hypothetical protein